jgi:predicted component of type VI protein secretion system
MSEAKSDLRSLLEQISKTKQVELPCDDVFKLMDEFADAVERGEDTTELMPLVQQHLEICRDCLEEYQALLKILHAEAKGK